MTGVDERSPSLFVLAAPLLRNRWKIAVWTFVGTFIALLLVFQRPALYIASTSFYPENTESLQSGVSNVLGQFGFSIGGASSAESPEFYGALLKSRVLLESLALDTMVVDELGGDRVSFLDFFEIESQTEAARLDDAVEFLSGTISIPASPRNTSLVIVTAATEWPSVSLFIVESLVDGVKAFNQNLVQGQAGAERRFVEDRLELATNVLGAAEEALEEFLNNNRQYSGSPELLFQRDRLDRNLSLQQEVYTTLRQSLEEARIREVRELPVISIVDPPSVRSAPEGRGRAVFLVLGFLVGAFTGTLLSLVSESVQRLWSQDNKHLEEFLHELKEAKSEFLTPLFRFRRHLRK